MSDEKLILNLAGVNFKFYSVLNKSQPVIKPAQEFKSEPVVKSKRRKSKQVAKYIYGDNNMIILNPKWSRKA